MSLCGGAYSIYTLRQHSRDPAKDLITDEQIRPEDRPRSFTSDYAEWVEAGFISEEEIAGRAESVFG
jgi:hypothetical protein